MVLDKKNHNIIIRAFSGVALILITVAAIFWIPYLFYMWLSIIALAMLSEWYDMAESSPFTLFLGLFIIAIPIISLLLINLNDQGQWFLLLLFTIIWSVDSFAMIGGRKFKGPKLAPKISPNKTWSGLITGIVASSCASLLLYQIPSFEINNSLLINRNSIVFFAAIIALIAQMSDLFISCFKRRFHIKDSGNIIPGHGGMLDRFDSIILTSPIIFLVTQFL